MSKPLSLIFAFVSIVFMSAMSISISHSIWLVVLFGALTICTIGIGFIVRARLRRRSNSSDQQS